MTDPRGRPIDDVDQARAVVDGDRASFVELMDCAEVGKSAGDYELRKDAAERAVNLAAGDTRQVASVHLAAQHLAAATLGEATDLDDLGRYVAALRSRLRRLVDEFPETGRNEKLQELEATLSEITLLLTNPEPAAQVRLCSRLRKLDRPDLGIKAAERGLNVEPENTALLTTLAAAQLDIGASTTGLATIERAIREDRKEYRVLLVHSRALQSVSRPEQSLKVAKEAFELDANEFTAHRILAAAAELRDLDTFEGALQFVRQHHEEVSAEADLYVLLLATEALLETDDVRRASELFQEVEANKAGKKLQGHAVQLYNRVKKQVRKVQQPMLPLDNDKPST